MYLYPCSNDRYDTVNKECCHESCSIYGNGCTGTEETDCIIFTNDCTDHDAYTCENDVILGKDACGKGNTFTGIFYPSEWDSDT